MRKEQSKAGKEKSVAPIIINFKILEGDCIGSSEVVARVKSKRR